MAGRFVRSSKYRHVFGRPTRKEQCYDNLRISKNAWDTNLVKANPEYIAVNWDAAGGGAFAVIPTNERGRLPARIPLFVGHTAVVLDTDWNPFNDSLICSGSDDGKVFLWRVPEGFTLHGNSPADDVKDIAPIGKLSGHPRKVGHVLFNPAAENVLASASGDLTIKLWDIEAGSAQLNLKMGDIVQSLTWSANGSLLATTSRDKKLRVWDVRQQKPAQEVQGHAGGKNSRAVWMGEHDRIATTGFSRMSDRQLALWDIRAAREPIGGFQSLDSISGVCMPFWDEGTQCLYLAGKGDGNIRYFEYENDKFEYLSEYKSADPQRGVAFVPKRGVNMHDNEVARAYKTVNDTYIEPISFIVPRRAEAFQEDIYPPAVGLKPAMSSGDWFGGKTAIPPKIDMETVYKGGGMQEIAPQAKTTMLTPEPISSPEPVKKESDPQPLTKEPPVKVTRGPPTSINEQGGSVMAMADKFMDKNGSKEESSDESSFEEVQRPMGRAAIKPATGDKKSEEVENTTSTLGNANKETGKGRGPSVLDEPGVLPPPKAAAVPRPGTTSPTSPTVGSSSAGMEGLIREIQNMKATIASQGRAIADLQEEMKKLKAKTS